MTGALRQPAAPVKINHSGEGAGSVRLRKIGFDLDRIRRGRAFAALDRLAPLDLPHQKWRTLEPDKFLRRCGDGTAKGGCEDRQDERRLDMPAHAASPGWPILAGMLPDFHQRIAG